MDDNFNFRTIPEDSNARRSYRVSENGDALDIWFKDSSIFIALPIRSGLIGGIEQLASQSGESNYRYEVFTKEQLLEAIKALTGLASAPRALPIGEPAREAQSRAVRVMSTKNVILYGPPGTGKTFETARAAVEICDGPNELRGEALRARYEQLRTEGRISFVTFHQSYGYEDFVEGLRPEAKDGQITYAVRPGIFREVCNAARRGTLTKPGLVGKPLGERTFYKMSLGRAGTADGNLAFQEAIERGYIILGWGEDIDFSECHTGEDIRKQLEEDHPNVEKPDSQARYVGVFKDELGVGDIIIVSQGNRAFRAIGEVTGEYEYLEAAVAGHYHQMRPVRWLAVFEGNRAVEEIYGDRKFMQQTLYRLDRDGLNLNALQDLIKGPRDLTTQPFVLIIDEINRANISKVFGELITLLEPDKREGAENALTVKLPYSGDDFIVPSNLYIIGTMNTADRSIALLDTALRRRFDFMELKPDPKRLGKIEDIDLGKLLGALNERIEYLYDRDHAIGHAYFMQAKTIGDLERLFRRKIIPLLQEYFYGDWSKVCAVLNDKNGSFIVSDGSVPHGLENLSDEYTPKSRYSVRSDFQHHAYRNIYTDE